VDSCSRHPLFLQAACQALLAHLDSKGEKRDVIERTDVDKALISQEFRDICMRYYPDQNEGKHKDKSGDEAKKEEKKKGFFSRIHGKDTGNFQIDNNVPPPGPEKKIEFLSDLHRITILAAIRLLFEEGKEHFTIIDIQTELKSYAIDASPNVMRNILDQLCLGGNFRLRDESTIIAKHELKILKDAEKNDPGGTAQAVAVQKPEEYVGSDTAFPKFTFEFGVKIFPKLLVAHLGGMVQCEMERKKLIEKGEWQEWLRRF